MDPGRRNWLSPQMMNAAFRRENINAVYLPLRTERLPDLLACVREVPLAGLSITMPTKKKSSGIWTMRRPTRKTGACNTVVRGQDGRLFGFNTDVAGAVLPVGRRLSLAGAKVLVIGAGGAARAAVYGYKSRGAEVLIVNRTPASGQRLARQAEAKYIKRADLKKHTFDVIVNATPVGMESSESPLQKRRSARVLSWT